VNAVFCPRCGTQRVLGMRFCASCGLDLESQAPAQPIVSGQPALPVSEYETVQIVDRDTGEMPVRVNVIATAFGTSAQVRHYLIAQHRWPGGYEDFPVAEYSLSAGQTPEGMLDRAGTQSILDDVIRWLVSEGWEEQPRGPIWYALAFRRAIQPGDGPRPIAPPQAAEVAAQLRQNSEKKAQRVERNAGRPRGTSLSVEALTYWILIAVVAYFAAALIFPIGGSAQWWMALIFIGAIVINRVLEYRRWKQRRGAPPDSG
jgi:hypothetical protein